MRERAVHGTFRRANPALQHRLKAWSDRLDCRWVDKPDQAVVLLSKRPFESSVVTDILSDKTDTLVQFENDVYAKVCSLQFALSTLVNETKWS